jgi:hypothetical protein
MSEVDRWLTALQKGIRELEDRHKRRLASGSAGDPDGRIEFIRAEVD